jgi:hypothetical protein
MVELSITRVTSPGSKALSGMHAVTGALVSSAVTSGAVGLLSAAVGAIAAGAGVEVNVGASVGRGVCVGLARWVWVAATINLPNAVSTAASLVGCAGVEVRQASEAAANKIINSQQRFITFTPYRPDNRFLIIVYRKPICPSTRCGIPQAASASIVTHPFQSD